MTYSKQEMACFLKIHMESTQWRVLQKIPKKWDAVIVKARKALLDSDIVFDPPYLLGKREHEVRLFFMVPYPDNNDEKEEFFVLRYLSLDSWGQIVLPSRPSKNDIVSGEFIRK